ncbi:MAG: tRNA uridine(34) 5-carboxymethylaminomethyl modification radical SAM/GNAT enzyme Elp3 [Candidatus Nanoarchaeia archaeon]|nr:tRNA uridine(34) 5-carboxymethylaminomethyl modification radical SAM/GNAT enzyme Elp3 [Candidatus Nanoarchaeia archaeon]MDD4563692.1 tRNA uridine(34) 5-carboxymethylaminomethyl modification radical SAM/GNAT enzyme Elp3 [Candidatus Nanoarchaeia archaeon]
MKKPTRTISGVAPIAVMLPPKPCPHGACLYCPTLNAPQSYTPESPAVLRAITNNYDSYKQTKARLKMYKDMKHPTDKIEIIIMGGTFLAYEKNFKESFVKGCYDALNNKRSKTLKEAKKLNETAKYRCVALCIETRPDICNDNHIKEMLNYGATRVELGVQAIDDKIYKIVNRGHKVKDVIEASQRLKKAGFKIGYHLMPGIIGSNPKKDIEMFKQIFKNQNYKPDQIKLYPCQVLVGSKLEELYWQGEYAPYTKEQTISILREMIKLTPRYCRIMRIMREIPPAYLIAGIKNIDLRKDIEEVIRKEKTKIKEIRFREIGFALRDKREVNNQIKIKKTKYKANNGIEFFIEAINKDDILFGLLRLRLDNNKVATIRELHVYGPALKLGEKQQEKYQHTGIGKKLMQTAEKIAKTKKSKKLRIISGVGVREYYKKLGYKLDKEKIYMEKEF